MTEPAPILLFTYKRLETLKHTVIALNQNRLALESDLFIFSDAAKTKKDEFHIAEIREYLKTISGFKSIHIFEARENKGLANSIIDGVTQVIGKYGNVIVLEDDLKTTPNFLSFMNDCLIRYENEKKIFSISGYSFNLGIDKGDPNDAYLLNRGWSWGWATWKDRWNEVDWHVKNYHQFTKDANARKLFALGGSDLNAMLEKQMSGKLDSWAIRWFFHQFQTKGLTVYPIKSKVWNNGFDQDATHTTGSIKRYLPPLDIDNKITFILPEKISVNTYYQRQFQNKMGVWSRIISKLETVLQRFIR